MNMELAKSIVIENMVVHLGYEKTQAEIDLLDFEVTHGQDAVVAMYGFLRYAVCRGVEQHKINTTIRHDLAGRNDQIMLPRTAGYIEFAER